ncbi:MAG: acyltransferase [Treponema sp.]|nr:acyltransferase [Treponema sp.]
MTKGDFSCIIIKTPDTVVDPSLSKRVNSLRFLLIVFVVIIHNGISKETFFRRNVMVIIPDYVENVQRLVGIITAIAVLMFFLFSAYFLYFKEQKYIPAMKKKCRTILLPYILWNLLLVLFYFLMQTLPFTKAFFTTTDPDLLIRNYEVIDWIDVFVGKFTERREGLPFIYQFWFLRDLFILNIFFTFIKKIVDTFPLGIFVLFFILWTNNVKIYIVSPEALLFFTLGYYVIKYNLGIKTIDRIKMLDISVAYAITIGLEYVFINDMPMLHKINILMGCAFFLKISRYFIENTQLYKILAWLEKYQFIVYAVHGVIIPQVLKIYIKLIPLNGVFILVGYFIMIIFGIFVSLLFGILFKRLLPKVYGIVTGGRI